MRQFPPLALAALLASAAHASLVIPDAKPLGEVVAMADVIVVVKASKGKSRVIKLPMPKGEPYERQQNPWTVVEVLRGDPKLVETTLYLDVFDWQFNMAMAETFREGGPMPSKITPSYRRFGKAPADSEPRVLFLRRSQGDPKDAFEQVVMDADESVKYLDKIKDAIRKHPPVNPSRGIGQP